MFYYAVVFIYGGVMFYYIVVFLYVGHVLLQSSIHICGAMFYYIVVFIYEGPCSSTY